MTTPSQHSRSSTDLATTGDATNAEGHRCGGCSRIDRRDFLSAASLLSIGAFLAACGDGVIDGPASAPPLVTDPIRIDFSAYPALSQVGGRALVTPVDRAPMMVERIATRQYRAFSLVCPHNGTIVEKATDGFVCPNHLARFAADGHWVGGKQTADLSPVGVSEVLSGGQPVALMVGGVVIPPAIAVSSAAVSFSTVVGGIAPVPQTVDITNGGGGTLTGITLSLAYGANQATGWLAASLSSITAPASLTLTASRGALTPGTYTATVTLAADGVAAPKSVAVTLLVIDNNAPASLQLSAASATFSTTLGASPTQQTVQVINAGGGTIGALTIAIAYGAGATGWLSTSSLSGTSTPATLTVRPATTALGAGTYTATITVSGAGVTARTLAVSVTVVAAGLAVSISSWPALATVGGVAGSVGTVGGTPTAVVRTGANSFAAFSLRCPHQGTTVQVVSGATFRCPNHGATWNGSGALQSNSPFRTSSLTPRTVTYNPGDATLYIT